MAFVKLPKSLLCLLLVLLVSLPVSISLPFVVFHGVNDDCKGVRNFVQLLSSLSGSPGYCIEIGNGKMHSIFMPMEAQAILACKKVKGMKELSGGYNIVGMSQGNMVARGVIEFCDGAPPVRNYVSLAGPHAGVSALPKCLMLGPSGYVKLPDQIPKYLEGCKYLPMLNNEKPGPRNSIHKARFSSLQTLVLIMFVNDNTLIPRGTAWFGYYPDGVTDHVVFPSLTRLYKEDWIGLKALTEAGKAKYFFLPGDHLQITNLGAKKYVVPYLRNKPSVLVEEGDESDDKLVYDGSSSYDFPPSVVDHLMELLSLNSTKL